MNHTTHPQSLITHRAAPRRLDGRPTTVTAEQPTSAAAPQPAHASTASPARRPVLHLQHRQDIGPSSR